MSFFVEGVNVPITADVTGFAAGTRTASRHTAALTRELRSLERAGSIAFRGLGTASHRIETSLVGVARHLNPLPGLLSKVRTTAYVAAGGVAALTVALAKQSTVLAAQRQQLLQGMRNQLGYAAAVRQVSQQLYREAKAPGLNYESALRGYQQLSIKGGAPSNLRMRIIRELANQVALGGGGPEEFGLAIRGTRQMFSKNRVSAEELQQQLAESAPGILSAVQSAFGTTDTMDRRLSGVKPDEFWRRILPFLERGARAGNGVANAFENLGSAFRELQVEFGTGLMGPDAARGLDQLTSKLEGLQPLARELGVRVRELAVEHGGRLLDWIRGLDFDALAERARAAWGTIVAGAKWTLGIAQQVVGGLRSPEWAAAIDGIGRLITTAVAGLPKLVPVVNSIATMLANLPYDKIAGLIDRVASFAGQHPDLVAGLVVAGGANRLTGGALMGAAGALLGGAGSVVGGAVQGALTRRALAGAVGGGAARATAGRAVAGLLPGDAAIAGLGGASTGTIALGAGAAIAGWQAGKHSAPGRFTRGADILEEVAYNEAKFRDTLAAAQASKAKYGTYDPALGRQRQAAERQRRLIAGSVGAARRSQRALDAWQAGTYVTPGMASGYQMVGSDPAWTPTGFANLSDPARLAAVNAKYGAPTASGRIDTDRNALHGAYYQALNAGGFQSGAVGAWGGYAAAAGRAAAPVPAPPVAAVDAARYGQKHYTVDINVNGITGGQEKEIELIAQRVVEVFERQVAST